MIKTTLEVVVKGHRQMKLNRRCTHLDNFDINKVLNAGFKLDPPTLHGESSIIEIELEEIEYEIIYWKSTVVCYVLGAHPPFKVLKGFLQRLWAKHGINKIVMLKNGIILVRFDSEVGKI